MMNPVKESATRIQEVCDKLSVFSALALKDETDNILWPMWSRLGLFSKIVLPLVNTKEGVMKYSVDEYNIVTRVLNRRLYNSREQVDAYAWSRADYEKKAKKAVPVGLRSLKGIINLFKLLNSMIDKDERKELFAFFRMMPCNFLLVHTNPEYRNVIEVTPELFEAGVTEIVNDWENAESGWTVTKLEVGDFLVVTEKGMYCIRREEFFMSHTTFESKLPRKLN